MDSIAISKQDMTVAGQENTLSPFGLLTQLFTQELLQRSAQGIGNYRPLRLAYLEEGDAEAAPQQAPEIHFDLDVNLLVNRLRQEEEKNRPLPFSLSFFTAWMIPGI